MTLIGLEAVVAETTDLAKLFSAAGHRLYLVGGIVRDLYLDRELSPDSDLDLTTDATPEQIKAVIAPVADALWLQGERFGTIGAHIGDRTYEITTHRHEIYRDDSRKPHVAFSTELDEDLSRRDFTINAMAVELPSVDLLDPFGGHDDLMDGILRTPLDPDLSFTDDPLRMLRAARFTAGYGLEPVPELIAAMNRLRERLDIVSAERVRDELDKLLSLAAPGPGLRLLTATQLMTRILPEVEIDTVTSRSDAIAQLPVDPVVRLPALLFGCDREQVRERLRHLRYSTERRHVTLAVLDAATTLADGLVDSVPAVRRWIHGAGAHRGSARLVLRAVEPDADDLIVQSEELEASVADELHDLGPSLSGEQVMQALELDSGPKVGEALDFLQELRFDHGPLDPSEAEVRLASWWRGRETV